MSMDDDYVAACAALNEAQADFDRNAAHMDDGPRVTAMAALATARFAKVDAAASLIRVSTVTPR
jgi:hypothetical protein